MHDPKKENSDIIKELIQEEKNTALQIFQKEVLLSRLEERLKAEEDKYKPFILSLRRPQTILVFAFLMVCFVVILWLTIFSKSSSMQRINTIEQFFGRTPGIQTIEKSLSYESNKKSLDVLPVEDIRKNIRVVLNRLSETSSLFPLERPSLIERKTMSEQDFEEKLGLIIRNKYIYRFLLKYSVQTKEGKNG